MPVPKYDRPELRPEGFQIGGSSVPHPKKPQAQPTDAFKPGSGKGNNGKG